MASLLCWCFDIYSFILPSEIQFIAVSKYSCLINFPDRYSLSHTHLFLPFLLERKFVLFRPWKTIPWERILDHLQSFRRPKVKVRGHIRIVLLGRHGINDEANSNDKVRRFPQAHAPKESKVGQIPTMTRQKTPTACLLEQSKLILFLSLNTYCQGTCFHCV